MRFSLRWALTGMAYVALAAAALSQGKWYYTEPLWAATFVAFGLGVVLALFARGRRQIAAAGFVVFMSTYVGFAWARFDRTPTHAILKASGLLNNNNTATARYAGSDNGILLKVASASSAAAVEPKDVSAVSRAGNVLSAMLAGLLGATLAPLPFRQEEDRPR